MLSRRALKLRAVRALVASCLLAVGSVPALGAGWGAGKARVAITPKTPTWMAGYGSRDKPSEGTIHDLWAKALVLRDPSGRLATLVTLDICGIGRDLSTRIRDDLKRRHGLERDRIVLACSHTHTGPVVGSNLISMYKIDDEQRRQIAAYAETFVEAVTGVVDEAIKHIEPAELSWGTGKADFAVNRRNNKEPEVPSLRERMELQGPIDHDLPVLRVQGPDGEVRAVVFGYACHCTVLGLNKFSGDYAGFAQIALEREIPGAQAMFVAGCGADQNPIPRRTVELAEAYGNQLAEGVQRVLHGSMRPIATSLVSSYEEIPLDFAKLPTREQVEADARSNDFFIASRARSLLKILESKESLDASYPYPIQVWRLGDLTWVFLGGEVVVDYSLRIKRNLGSSHTWVSGYCNDVMAYIPSLRVLTEGGYEGAGAMVYYGLPSPWSEAVEVSIIHAVDRLVDATKPKT